MMIEPATGWFDIVKMPTEELDEAKTGNDEYIYQSSARVSQWFNNTRLHIYPRPRKVVFDN